MAAVSNSTQARATVLLTQIRPIVTTQNDFFDTTQRWKAFRASVQQQSKLLGDRFVDYIRYRCNYRRSKTATEQYINGRGKDYFTAPLTALAYAMVRYFGIGDCNEQANYAWIEASRFCNASIISLGEKPVGDFQVGRDQFHAFVLLDTDLKSPVVLKKNWDARTLTLFKECKKQIILDSFLRIVKPVAEWEKTGLKTYVDTYKLDCVVTWNDLERGWDVSSIEREAHEIYEGAMREHLPQVPSYPDVYDNEAKLSRDLLSHLLLHNATRIIGFLKTSFPKTAWKHEITNQKNAHTLTVTMQGSDAETGPISDKLKGVLPKDTVKRFKVLGKGRDTYFLVKLTNPDLYGIIQRLCTEMLGKLFGDQSHKLTQLIARYAE